MVHIVSASPVGSLLDVVSIPLQPSRGLLAFLAAQPRGSTVAVDQFAEVPAEFSPAVNQYLIDSGPYRAALFAAIHNCGHTLLCIDDLSFITRQETLLQRAFDMAPDGLHMYRADRPSAECSGLSDPAQNQALYRLLVDAFYIRVIERTNFLIDAVVEAKPTVAILTPLVAPELYRRSHERGLPVESFNREIEVLDVYAPDESTPHFESKVFPDMDVALPTTVQRARFAVDLGRILPDRTPDYIGTWRPSVPAEGLFEMYVTERRGDAIFGSIEDSLGSAGFDGRITDNEVGFEKFYDDQAVRSGGISSEILYSGKKTGGRYHGSYGARREQGDFWLAPFHPDIAASMRIARSE